MKLKLLVLELALFAYTYPIMAEMTMMITVMAIVDALSK